MKRFLVVLVILVSFIKAGAGFCDTSYPFLIEEDKEAEMDAYILQMLNQMDSEESVVTISETALYQSYPNPAGAGCFIPFKLSANSNQLSVEIYNILGQRVRTIDAGPKKAGDYTKQDTAIYWDGKNAIGIPVSNGLYFYKLILPDKSFTRSLTITK